MPNLYEAAKDLGMHQGTTIRELESSVDKAMASGIEKIAQAITEPERALLDVIRAQVQTFRCEMERGDTGSQNAVRCGEPNARLCLNCMTLIGPHCQKETRCGDSETEEHKFLEH